MLPKGRCCIAVLLLCCGQCFSEDRAAAAYGDEFLSVLVASNEKNRSSIYSARGKALVVFERQVNEGVFSLAHPGAPGMGNCYERRQIEWYVLGDKRRTDIVSLDIPPDKERGMLPCNMKQFWSPATNVYVHWRPSGRVEAYINNPMRQEYFVPRLAASCFDPMSFYKYFDRSLEQWVTHAKKTNALIEVTAKDGQYIVGFAWGADPSAPRDKMTMVISPKMGSNVTQVDCRREGKPLFNMTVEYAEGGGNGARAFFPRRYESAIFALAGVAETVCVDFSDVKVNEAVEERVFTLESMGIPPGSIIRDMRYDPAHPIVAFYGGMPDKEMQTLLDDIDPTSIRNAIGEGQANGVPLSGGPDANHPSGLPGEASESTKAKGGVPPAVSGRCGIVGWAGLMVVLLGGVSVAGVALLRRRRSE